MTEKICPVMSVPGTEQNPAKARIAYCRESRCALWISMYTTEGGRMNGCAFALHPTVNNGQVRV